jgi:16S rRNA (adenine1518-N6/adenine1519-N6)-dimethyltransferase
MKHVARKRFGQHFLTDAAIIDAIVDAIAPQPGDAMVEIGPGLAALTQPLVERLGKLTVIELDRDLAVRLRNHPQLSVVQADVLKVDFSALAVELAADDPAAVLRPACISPVNPTGGPELVEGPAQRRSVGASDPAAGPPQGGVSPLGGQRPAQRRSVGAPSLRVVGNLPYNISTPILFHLLDHVAVVQDQHFMLQKEVIDRMVAPPGSKDYGRLSVMLQWRYAMENVLFVPPESFDPPPRVDSAIVRMVPLATPPAIDLALFGELVQTAFSQRRKILRNTLGKWLEARGFAGEFDLQRRAEEVPVAEYVALAQAVQA